jgi:hypothetical protein
LPSLRTSLHLGERGSERGGEVKKRMKIERDRKREREREEE